MRKVFMASSWPVPPCLSSEDSRLLHTRPLWRPIYPQVSVFLGDLSPRDEEDYPVDPFFSHYLIALLRGQEGESVKKKQAAAFGPPHSIILSTNMHSSVRLRILGQWSLAFEDLIKSGDLTHPCAHMPSHT